MNQPNHEIDNEAVERLLVASRYHSGKETADLALAMPAISGPTVAAFACNATLFRAAELRRAELLRAETQPAAICPDTPGWWRGQYMFVDEWECWWVDSADDGKLLQWQDRDGLWHELDEMRIWGAQVDFPAKKG